MHSIVLSERSQSEKAIDCPSNDVKSWKKHIYGDNEKNQWLPVV